MRAALYWIPDARDPLLAAGNTWLGRDPSRGAHLAQPEMALLQEATSGPRLYGFHATLRPPMRLATGWEEFLQAAREIAFSQEPFELPRLEVTDVDSILALTLCAPCPALHRLADACIAGTDRHRLRAAPEEIEQRRAGGLSALEDEMLMRWGYPYAMGTWRFHMTLSRRLNPVEMAQLRPLAKAHFATALARPRRASSINVFTQRQGSAFRNTGRLPLRQ